MGFWKRILVILLVSLCCIGGDQSSKYVATEHLTKNTMTSYFNDTVRIGYTENKGAFLGMGKNLPEQSRFLIFTVLVGLFLAAFLLYMVFSSSLNLTALVALSCIFSGGTSNLYDRALNNGAVVDFLNIGIGPLRTGIFNIADMAILFGAGLFLIASWTGTDTEEI